MLLTDPTGTPGYLAPEVLDRAGYDEQVDNWAAGVVLYIVLCGFPPFYDEETTQLHQSIRAARYDFPSPYWDHVSIHSQRLIQSLLVVDPHARLSAQQALEHVWMQNEDARGSPRPRSSSW